MPNPGPSDGTHLFVHGSGAAGPILVKVYSEAYVLVEAQEWPQSSLSAPGWQDITFKSKQPNGLRFVVVEMAGDKQVLKWFVKN